MLKFASRFWADERGTTAIEYALIGSGIFLAIISAVSQVGTQLQTVFTNVQTGL